MIARFASLLIVLFWLTMTALLIRNEVTPERSGVRTVPVSHVMKLLYLHEQPSDLFIYNEAMRIGNLRLHPTIRPEDNVRLLEFNGNLHLRFPGVKQRFSWDGSLEMNAEFAMDRFSFGITVHEPSEMRGELQITSRDKTAQFTLLSHGHVVEEEQFTLDREGLERVITKLNGDPTLLTTLHGQTTGLSPKITAQQSSLKIQGEEIETYLIVIQQSGQTLLECHFDQLGKVLRARTAIGYTLAPPGVSP